MSKICIIGGGISGLSIARKKKRLGHTVRLLESSHRVGGVIESKKTDGFLLDYSANTLNVRLKSTKAILEECGAWNCCIDANPSANKRMIVRNGKVIELPTNFSSFVKSSFLSKKAKLRLLLEPLISKSINPTQESVSSFISRRFGEEVLQYAANPFLAGIYAAKPESLNLNQTFPVISELERKYRSILWGVMRTRKQKNSPRIRKARLISFQNGLEEIVHMLSSSIKDEICLNHKVKKIIRKNNIWEVCFETKEKKLIHEEFNEVISTIPSHKIKSIEWDEIIQKDQLETLSKATHFPLALVYLGFKEEHISHPLDGFGFLVPEIEKLKILGTLFSSTLFPNRSPDGQVLLTTFIGGERNPNLALLPDPEIIAIAKNELKKLLGINGKATFEKVKKWPHAIPLPDQSMEDRKQAAKELKISNKGLSFSGSFISGVSLPNCLEGS